MAKSIKAEAFDSSMDDLLADFMSDMTNIVEEEIDDTAKQMLKAVKECSPSWGENRTGEYKKGWEIVKEFEYLRTKRIIWNKKHYRRVHLLEKGHASRGGGRVRAFPHVEPAYKKYGEPLPNKIAKRIKEGDR